MGEHRSSWAEVPTSPDAFSGTGPILPDQYFPPSQASTQSGVHRLFAAVLADGVQLYCETCRRRDPEARRLAAETEAWIESDDRTQLFSFLSLCSALEVDPGSLRRRLRRWRDGREPQRVVHRRSHW